MTCLTLLQGANFVLVGEESYWIVNIQVYMYVCHPTDTII